MTLSVLREYRPNGPFLALEAPPDPLTYPRHPFPPTLGKNLSRLPEGFAEVALSGSLSFKMIDILLAIARARNELDFKHSLQRVQMLHSIHVDIRASFPAPGTSDIEKYLFYGLKAFCVQLDEHKQDHINRAIGITSTLTSFSQLTFSSPVQHRECVIWNYISYAGAASLEFRDPSYTNQVMDSVLKAFPEARSWESLEAIIRQFFWTEKTLPHWKSCWEGAMDGRRLAAEPSLSWSVGVSES